MLVPSGTLLNQRLDRIEAQLTEMSLRLERAGYPKLIDGSLPCLNKVEWEDPVWNEEYQEAPYEMMYRKASVIDSERL